MPYAYMKANILCRLLLIGKVRVMKKLITVINSNIPLAKALNAAAHTVFGMGYRIEAFHMPDIYVYLADTLVIRAVKETAYRIAQLNMESVIYADFTNTMGTLPTDEQLIRTRATKEADMQYYAVSICANDDILHELEVVLSKCRYLPNYSPLINENQNKFVFLPPRPLLDNHDSVYKHYDNYKAVIAFNKKHNIECSINAMLQSCIELGRQADFISLHLIAYIDANNIRHTNISYHAIPIVTAKNQNKLDDIAHAIKQDNKIISSIIQDDSGKIIMVAVFGDTDNVDIYTKQCSILTKEIVPQKL